MTVRAALNALLTAAEFQTLEGRLRRQSAFHILGIEGREVHHAALLAWLLDPRASHGMGAVPLRRFLLLSASLAESEGMIDATDIDNLDVDALVVETEFLVAVPGSDRTRRLDVLVSLPPGAPDDERGAPILLVEYKVDASEGEDQTADYAKWAGARGFDLGGRPVLPLQVFLCPALGEEEAPARPFVFVDYDSYVGWLDFVSALDTTQQATFLLREFRSCLRQRSDVGVEDSDALVKALAGARGEAIETLRKASAEALRPHGAVLARHEEVFGLLGITRKRRSKGSSPFVAAVRAALVRHLDPSLWRMGGQGSLDAIFLPSQERARQHALERGHLTGTHLRLHYYMDRPRNERSRLVLEVMGDVAGFEAGAPNRRLRETLAASLRKVLPRTLLEHPCRGQIVYELPIVVPGVMSLEADTEERAQMQATAIETLATKAAEVEKPLLDWVAETLPALLVTPPTA